MAHSHILEGMEGGYMPDSNTLYRTKREALGGMRWSAESARGDGFAVTGSAERGFYILDRSYLGAFGLDLYIALVEDCDEDCDPDEVC